MLRKGLLSKGKKKWIIGGALLFGGVSLLTTGFATWIVGINQLRQNLGTVVQVEGTLNESVQLIVTASSTPDALGVNVGENHDKGPNEIVGNSEGETDFVVNLDLTIEVGNEYLTKNTLTDITFEFNYEEVEGISNNKTSNNKINVAASSNTHKAGDYTYLDIDSQSTIAVKSTEESGVFTKSELTSAVTYTVSNLSVTLFKWGSFFDGMAPSAYYNKLYNDSEYKSSKDLGITDSADDQDLVVRELTALQEALHNGTIVVTALLNTTPVV